MRVLIADDHPMVRDALARIVRQLRGGGTSGTSGTGGTGEARPLEKLQELQDLPQGRAAPGIHEVGEVDEAHDAHDAHDAGAVHEVRECEDLEGLLRAAASRTWALAIVDLNMPGMRGFDGLHRLRAVAPGMTIVVASGQDDAATVRGAMLAGAAGFVSKGERPDVLLGALELICAGGRYVPARSFAHGAAPGGATPVPVPALTARQLDVLRCLMDGDPNKVIARKLGVTESTVKLHLAALLRALRARNRTEAVMRAHALGLAPKA